MIVAASIALLPSGPLIAEKSDAPLSLIERGERIYRTGVLASGEVLQARVQGDVPVSGKQVTCVQCHRRSGFGSTESERRVPPITAGILYSPKVIARRGLHASRVEGAGTRPAYTDESLARAIRNGIDPVGRNLDPSMPRFALPDADMKALVAYLKSLSAATDPGVTETELHIATLIGPGVEPQRSDAMLAVMNTYLEAKNSGTRNETRRAKFTPWQKDSSYPAYRRWVLHPWRLEGGPEQWPDQLQHYYEKQPVFALIGGVVDGEFQRIADFCNANKLPCLFPSSDLPATNPGFYTLHFTAGRRLEADALATHLREEGLLEPDTDLLQISRRTDATGADRFREAIQDEVALQEVHPDAAADKAFWKELGTADVLVLWLDPSELNDLSVLPRPWPKRIYLQSTLNTKNLNSLPEALRKRIHLLYPYALPDTAAPQRLRVKTWLRLNGVEFDAPRVQSDSYFALTLFNDTMRSVGLNFSRSYAIETIEHMLDSALFTSLYPQVSLAPEQRFASKGCYIVRLPDAPSGKVVPASRWIVP
ncbi:MAG: hypothetical protein R6X15_09995 [Pseudomonadota bacterium]